MSIKANRRGRLAVMAASGLAVLSFSGLAWAGGSGDHTPSGFDPKVPDVSTGSPDWVAELRAEAKTNPNLLVCDEADGSVTVKQITPVPPGLRRGVSPPPTLDIPRRDRFAC